MRLPPPDHKREEFSWPSSLDRFPGVRLVRARLERRRQLRAVGGREAEQELQQLEAEEKLQDQQLFQERSKPLYLCDRSAVQMMLKAVRELGPSPLGSWVQQQLEAGYLWSCTAVEEVPGWKMYTFDSELADCGRPFLVQRVFGKLGLDSDAVNDPELYHTVATYARVHSFVEDAPYNRFKRLVTANRAFESLILASEERRSATLDELYGISYVFRRGNLGPVVLFVDDVQHEKPEGLPFQEGDIASAEAERAALPI